MDKPATDQRKTDGRSKKTGTRAHAAASGTRKSTRTKSAPTQSTGAAKAKKATARRAGNKPENKSAKPAASRRARIPRSRKPPVWQPTFALPKGDRIAFLVLLAPFALMAIAVGGTHALDQAASVYRQLAKLSGPVPVVQVAAAPRTLTSLPPQGVKLAAARMDEIALEPVEETAATLPAEATLSALPARDQVAVRIAQTEPAGICVSDAKTAKLPQSTPPPPVVSASTFGDMLAHAARAQTRDLVVYTDEYRQIGFPMGDVPNLYGVCTDVVIRAYRSLGIDLQVLVHKARIGTGDTSIDHRRTKTLRRFFERYGESIPVTDFAEDYLPGDIVTYYRASGRTSQTHIAIVSDVIAPSGRPMIVHNRGWGPQLEDALFANNITGHYRFNHVESAEQARANQSTADSTVR